MNQATGLERFELLSKLNGEDPFFMEPLKVDYMGTLQKPIVVKSLVSSERPPFWSQSGLRLNQMAATTGPLTHHWLLWLPRRLVSVIANCSNMDR